MARILALVLVVVLLVVSGFWVARRAGGGAGGIAAADTVGGVDAGSAVDPNAEPAASAEPAAGAALPEGTAAVPYLSDAPQRSFEGAAQVLEPDLDYYAVLETSKGPITIDLFEQQAPRTVNNFVFLALHHFYDGVPFHRVLQDFMAQTGDPTGTGTGGPGYRFDDEIAGGLHFDKRGVVAMANAGPDTNGSQFFLTFGPAPWLDGGYNIFGQVVGGDAVLDALTRIDPQTPSAVAHLDDTLASLADQGTTLPGPPGRTVGEALQQALGTLPVAGQTFSVAGLRGVVGNVGDRTAVGFFPQPDTLERVLIAQRPRS